MPAPTVSVVIPCHNGSLFLRETLESALNQTRAPLEVIVVDDGSSDDSAAIAESFGAPVRVIRQRNQGESVARNRAMDEAKGDWIAFLDADDLWEPDKLQMQIPLARDDIVCVHSGYYLFGMTNRVEATPRQCLHNNYSVEGLITEPLILTITALVRADVSVRFPEWTQHAEDMIYFAEVAQQGQIGYVDRPLAGYRMHRAQQTKGATAIVQSLRSRMEWVTRTYQATEPETERNLHRALREHVVEAINIARWLRQWERYWALREFAAALEWPEGRPRVLAERPYPRALYAMKDHWDNLWKRYPGASANTARQL